MEQNTRMRRRDIIRENKRRLAAKRTGRMLLLLIVALLITAGCTGGGGGVLGVSPELDKVLEDGWHNLRYGRNDVAVTRFTEIVHQAPDRWEESSAYTGLGWAYANLNDVEKSITYFKKVENKSNDANLGYAAVLLNRGSEGDYALALKLLKNIHLDNIVQHYVSENRIDVSDAEAHALIAIAYYYNGYRKEAAQHIQKARDLDVTGANDKVNRIYEALMHDLELI